MVDIGGIDVIKRGIEEANDITFVLLVLETILPFSLKSSYPKLFSLSLRKLKATLCRT